MAAKICTIEIKSQGNSCFVAVPDWLSPKDSLCIAVRDDSYFFTSKRSAQVFAKRLKTQLKNRGYKFTIVIDDLSF